MDSTIIYTGSADIAIFTMGPAAAGNWFEKLKLRLQVVRNIISNWSSERASMYYAKVSKRSELRIFFVRKF